MSEALKSENKSAISPEDEQEDIKNLAEVIMALKLYRKCSYAHLNKAESYIKSLPKRQRIMLAKYRQHLLNLRHCIDQNQDVINKMLCADAQTINDRDHAQDSIEHCVKNIGKHELEKSAVTPQPLVTDTNTDVQPYKILKAQSVLKLIARDWSAVCADEREQSYQPIIDAIEEFFKPKDFEPSSIRVLVPGSGLGRLTYELACRGYECEGNEFSYFMLIASNFILNQCKQPYSYTLYPWVHQHVNNLSEDDQLTSIQFPDVCMTQQQPKGKLIMVAGDFLQVYKTPNSYDCIATCFFIDCANNIIDFIETIYRILIPGGIWVNLGPLLYNYCDIEGENSIEPTYDQLVPIIKTIGFEVLRTKVGLRTRYAQNTQSMLKSEYESVFWICRKPDDAREEANDFSTEESQNFDIECDTQNTDSYNVNNKKTNQNGFRNYYD